MQRHRPVGLLSPKPWNRSSIETHKPAKHKTIIKKIAFINCYLPYFSSNISTRSERERISLCSFWHWKSHHFVEINENNVLDTGRKHTEGNEEENGIVANPVSFPRKSGCQSVVVGVHDEVSSRTQHLFHPQTQTWADCKNINTVKRSSVRS